MRKRRHSLSGRLLLLFIVTAVLLALNVRTGFRIALDQNMEEMAAPHLAEYVQHLLDELGNPPTSASAAALAERLPLRIYLSGGQDWSTGGAAPSLNPGHSVLRKLPDGSTFQVSRGHEGFMVRTQRDGVTIVLAPAGFELAEYARLTVILTIVALLIVLVLAYHAIRRLFRPIEAIQAGVARIGSGDLGHRLDIRRRDELGELAASVNAMADDIQQMLEAKRELLLAISHELRSPLTRARVNAELLDDNPSRRALLTDLGELESLLAELLESERLSGRHVALNRQAVDPSALLQELVAESFKDALLELDLDPQGTWISLDPVRIRLLVRNLLNNAIDHTPPGQAPPLLASHVGDAVWCLSVTDHGPGVAAEHLGLLTEPFYRADPSRQRASGGVGLGLYLSRVIAEAHGGKLEVKSDLGKGMQVRLELPLPVDG
ncbi:MAG: HAMP domain-containing sensor histidine kinase [Sedimenticolaceae bacterium]